MSDLTRRGLLRNVAAATAATAFTPAMAQKARETAADERASTGGYRPKGLNEHEYKTLQKLSDWIIPASEQSQGALKAGAADWIDLLSSENPQMLAIYSGGIAWTDNAMQRLHKTDFLSAKREWQRELLDTIAYKKNESPQFGPGIRFFAWARKMVVDAYYTSPAGIKELGYIGNTALAKFEVPPECIDYALKHSPA